MVTDENTLNELNKKCIQLERKIGLLDRSEISEEDSKVIKLNKNIERLEKEVRALKDRPINGQVQPVSSDRLT